MKYYYCFEKLQPIWETDEDGESYPSFSPIFPDSVGWLLLADYEKSTWNLYECSTNNDKWSPNYPVTKETYKLIDLAKEEFPPALALMREEISLKTDFVSDDLIAFEKLISDVLKKYLAMKDDNKFILAEVNNEEIGYLYKDEIYWVLGLSAKNPNYVKWVSDDYFVYTNHIDDFLLTQKQKDNLTIIDYLDMEI